MQLNKILSIALLTMLLSACGDGVEGSTETPDSPDSTESIDTTTPIDSKNPLASVALDLTTRLLDCPSGWKQDITQCSDTTEISAIKPGVVAVSLSQSGVALTSQIISATVSKGELKPDTKLTNSSGFAFFTLAANSDEGAGRITITTDAAEQETISTLNFEIGASNVDIAVENNLAGMVLAQNSTALITVNLTTDEGPYLSPVEVTFSSECAANGTANLDATVKAIKGVAQATYQPVGCVGDDVITVYAEVNNLSASTTVTVASSPADSIQFLSAAPENIAIQGTGGAGRQETAKVLFKVVDQSGLPSSSQEVQFSLVNGPFGTTIEPIFAKTNSAGEVYTVVSAGKVPGPVQVKANISDPSLIIASVSSELSVSTGLPDQNSFSVSLENFSPEALEYDGVKVGVSVQLADHYNNAVPDGTSVFFHTEAGAINDLATGTVGSCTTEGSQCSVNWVSGGQEPQGNRLDNQGLLYGCANSDIYSFAPCITAQGMGQPYGGRVTITAYSVGEESFVDRNSDGEFTPGESFSDDNCDGTYTFSEPFVDSNGDGKFTEAEAFIDSDQNGFYTVKESYVDVDGDGVYSPAEEFIDINGDGIYNKAERFTDSDGNNAYTAAEAYTDSNGDGEYTALEKFTDSNGNGEYDAVAEDYIDSDGNGKYTAQEKFTDNDGDGKYTSPEAFIDADGNGVYTPPEPYTDLDGNGAYTEAEVLITDRNGDGVYTPDELFVDADGNGKYTKAEVLIIDHNGDGVYTLAESFTDTNNDGSYTSDEPFTDANADGVYTDADTFIDVGNGIYTPAEEFTDTDGNSVYTLGEEFTDTDGNGIYTSAEEFTDTDGNEIYTFGESYVDVGNGIYTPAESFTDTDSNGVYTLADAYIDRNNDGEYTLAEPYTDTNKDNKYSPGDPYSDANGDGKYSAGDAYQDSNGDGRFTLAEAYTDSDNNGSYTYAETYVDSNGNGTFDFAEKYTDSNGDGKYTATAEDFTDSNGDGSYTAAEPFTDSNGDGLYTAAESFIDLNGDGIFTAKSEDYTDTNGDERYSYAETFTDIDGNGQYTVRDSFDDANGDGKYTGDTFNDRPELFYDDNEDGFFKANKRCDIRQDLEDNPAVAGASQEESNDINQDGEYSFANKLFNGMLCSESNAAAGLCERELVHVSDNITLIMASSEQYMRIQNNGRDVNHVDLTTATGEIGVALSVYIADIYNNRPPAGSVITVETTNGVISGGASIQVPSSNALGPYLLYVNFEREKEPNKIAYGTAVIQVTTPNGTTSSYNIGVSDDG